MAPLEPFWYYSIGFLHNVEAEYALPCFGCSDTSVGSTMLVAWLFLLRYDNYAVKRPDCSPLWENKTERRWNWKKGWRWKVSDRNAEERRRRRGTREEREKKQREIKAIYSLTSSPPSSCFSPWGISCQPAHTNSILYPLNLLPASPSGWIQSLYPQWVVPRAHPALSRVLDTTLWYV